MMDKELSLMEPESNSFMHNDFLRDQSKCPEYQTFPIVFTSCIGTTFLIYLWFSVRILFKYEKLIDKFSRTIIIIYIVGFFGKDTILNEIVKTLSWVSYTVIVNWFEVDLCPNLHLEEDKDNTLKWLELAESKVEDLVNSTFQVILYVFVFKMINVYNIARCESVQEL